MRGSLLAFFFLLCGGLAAQQAERPDLRCGGPQDRIWVEAGIDQRNEVLLRGTWRMGAAISFTYERPQLSTRAISLRLDAFLLPAIDHLLDQHIHFRKHGVEADASVEQLVEWMDAVVRAALMELAPSVQFGGLKASTIAQLEWLCDLRWGGRSEGYSVDERYLIIHRSVRGHRGELMRQIRADLLPLAQVELLLPIGIELDPRYNEPVPTVCGTVFDEDNLLCALDLGMEPELMNEATATLELRVLEQLEQRIRDQARSRKKVRKQDRWLFEELDALHRRMGRLEERLRKQEAATPPPGAGAERLRPVF